VRADGSGPGVPLRRNFLPGPVGVHPTVLQAQAAPTFGHRGPAFQALMTRLQEGLRPVFRTQRSVCVVPSSATGLMEAAIRNGVRRRVLCLVNGSFSARFARIARACGREVKTLEVPLGSHHAPQAVDAALHQGDFDAVTVVHSETSTGVLNPVEKIADVVADHPDTLLLVDTVSSLGGARVEPDAWGLDVLLTGSQKALGLPPGLAFAVVSERTLERAAGLEGRGLYFDFVELHQRLERMETPTTPALSLLAALDVQLERLAAEGMEARWDRHARMARRVYAWVDHMRQERGVPLEVLAAQEVRSPTVTCIRLPRGWAGPALVGMAAARGWLLSPGYGPLKEGSFRIGHMGDQEPDALEELLADLEEILVGG
jgi:aspartate aminotransferase-like enzyme